MNDLDKLIRQLEGADYYEPHPARGPKPMWVPALWWGAAFTGIGSIYCAVRAVMAWAGA